MLLIAATLITLISPQEPAPPEVPAPPATEPQRQSGGEVWDDERARAEIAAYRQAIKGGKVPRDQRAEAAAQLARGSNRRLVLHLYRIVSKDPDAVVRRAAARGLAHQPGSSVVKAVRKLLRDEDLRGDPTLLAILVRALDQTGYDTGRDWELLCELFQLEYVVVQAPLKQAILALIEHHREDRAIAFLAEYVDPPEPEHPDDPNNPPATYWKARWDEWMVWRADLARTLQELTGRSFDSGSEVEDWIREQRGKSKRRGR